MVAQPSQPTFMSVDEWRDLERHSHDIKHEYINGQVYAMAGGSRAHGRISSNAVRTLEDALDDSPCNVYNSDVAARLSPTCYTYPDATVTCDERDQATPDETEIQSPRVIVEVLSDSTEAYNRGEKFALYRACPTVQEYVLVATKYHAVEVFHRTLKGWEYQAYGPGDEVELASIGVRFPLAMLYRRTTVPETLDAPEGEV
ncbi:MAG TPA: Uma2 family endonuclease [Ktedonobacteraceae bacterium]|nr:Uma2 family endonuclease [Ktedonobacteraceae bacterium]